MFLFFDVLPFRKQLEYNQTITCSRCGHFGRYEVYLVGNRFRLFFIPVITFGKKIPCPHNLLRHMVPAGSACRKSD